MYRLKIGKMELHKINFISYILLAHIKQLLLIIIQFVFKDQRTFVRAS